jgi:hypothetical protein
MALSTEQNLEIVKQAAEGVSIRKSAAAIGISPVTVENKRKILREMIETVRQKVIDEALEKSAENIIGVIKGYKENKAQNKGEEMEKSHGFIASMKNLESAGVLASNIQSLTIQQIYNDNRNEVPESIKQLIGAVQKRDMCKSLDEEIIDI